MELSIRAAHEPSVSRTEVTLSLLSGPHKAGRENPDQQKPLDRRFPLHPNSPFPSPKHKHALLSTLLAQYCSPKGSARAPPPLFQARREWLLPPRCSLTTASSGCQAWCALGRPFADGEGAATALPKGCFRSSAQCKRRQAALPEVGS